VTAIRTYWPAFTSEWRQAHARASQRLSRLRLRRAPWGREGRPICPNRRHRYWRRHDLRADRARLRAVLYNQTRGSRLGLEPGLWLRQTVRRPYPDLRRGGPGHDRQTVLAKSPRER